MSRRIRQQSGERSVFILGSLCLPYCIQREAEKSNSNIVNFMAKNNKMPVYDWTYYELLHNVADSIKLKAFNILSMFHFINCAGQKDNTLN